MERTYMFLEEHQWKKASEYADKILDIAPKSWEAHLIKLLADCHCTKKEQLVNCKNSFEENINYTRVILYGDDLIKEELELYINTIKEREKKKALEKQTKKEKVIHLIKRITPIAIAVCIFILSVLYLFGQVIIPHNKYKQAEALLAQGKYEEAVDIFIDIYYYKDASVREWEIRRRNYLEIEGLTIPVPYYNEYATRIEKGNRVWIGSNEKYVSISDFWGWCSNWKWNYTWQIQYCESGISYTAYEIVMYDIDDMNKLFDFRLFLYSY